MSANLRVQAFVYGLLAAFFFGTHSVIVRFLTRDFNGITIAVIRLYIASLILLVILRIKRQPVTIPIRDRTFLITVAAAAVNYILFHVGLEYTTASNAMLLENMAPFFVLLLLFVFWRERARPMDIAATALAIIGVVFVVQQDVAIGGEGLKGDLLELGAAVTWAVFIIGSNRGLADINTPIGRIGYLFGVFLLAAIVLTPLAFLDTIVVSTEDAVMLVLLGVFPTAVAYLLWYEAIARVSTISSALLFSLSVVFTFVNASLFLGEAVTWRMIVGGVLIVGGIVLSKRES